jgi:imidazole glycerol-phosphate synthase subunit HisH
MRHPQIGVLEVGIGNIGSLTHALYSLGYDWVAVRSADDLAAVSHLVMPGVGTFSDAMQRIDAAGMREAVRTYAQAQMPVLGICLGMQLLANFGEEAGGAQGFGLIPGEVRHLPRMIGVRLPHVGWNTVHRCHTHPVMQGIRDDVDFYFVHSYRFHCAEGKDAVGITDHGEKFPSIVACGSVMGVQFHPEKSQRNGLQLLDNFCQWEGR